MGGMTLITTLPGQERPAESSQEVIVGNPPSYEAPSSSSSSSTSLCRFSVLGLAGITVNQVQYEELKVTDEKATRSSNTAAATTTSICPSPPDQMRAVVAVSRTTQQIAGITDLSKNLTLPSSSNQQSHRHVAVWANEQERSLGSLMNFSLNGKETTFELTIGLTNADNSSSPIMYALPIGLAKLTLTEDMTPDGDTIILDIPIQQPSSTSEMIAIQAPSNQEGDEEGKDGEQQLSPQNDANNSKKQQKKKKKRWFGSKKRKDDEEENLNIPTMAQRKAFKSVYAIDPSGDAVMRVEFQVIPKPKEEKKEEEEVKTNETIVDLDESVATNDESKQAQMILKELEMQAGTMEEKKMFARLAKKKFSTKKSKLEINGDIQNMDNYKPQEEESKSNTVSGMFQQARGALDATFSNLFVDDRDAKPASSNAVFVDANGQKPSRFKIPLCKSLYAVDDETYAMTSESDGSPTKKSTAAGRGGGVSETKDDEQSSMASLRESIMKQRESGFKDDVIGLFQCGDFDGHTMEDDPFFGLDHDQEEEEEEEEEEEDDSFYEDSTHHVPGMILRKESLETMDDLTIESALRKTPPRSAWRQSRDEQKETSACAPVALGGNGVCSSGNTKHIDDDSSLLDHVNFRYFNNGPCQKDDDDAEKYF